MSTFRSILKPEASVMAAIAVAGTVYAVYNLSLGSMSAVSASDPNHPALSSSRKKAGYTAFTLVSALFLITKDGNVATIGYGSIVAMEVAYRHGIMVDPNSLRMQTPSPAAYTPAENVTPLYAQADTAADAG